MSNKPRRSRKRNDRGGFFSIFRGGAKEVTETEQESINDMKSRLLNKHFKDDYAIKESFQFLRSAESDMFVGTKENIQKEMSIDMMSFNAVGKDLASVKEKYVVTVDSENYVISKSKADDIAFMVNPKLNFLDLIQNDNVYHTKNKLNKEYMIIPVDIGIERMWFGLEAAKISSANLMKFYLEQQPKTI